MKRLSMIGATMSVATALIGCGGGSDNSDGAAGGPAASGRVITDQNAASKTADGYRAASALYGGGAEGADAGLNTKDASAEPAGRVSLIDLSLRRFDTVARLASPPAMATKAVLSENAPCAGGGTLALTADDADGNGYLSTGDAVRFQFHGCREDGVTMDGMMSMTNLVITGVLDAPARTFGATFTFTSLRAADGRVDATVDGGFSLQASMQSSPSKIIEATVIGGSLQTTTNGVVERLSNFRSDLRVDVDAGRYVYSVAGTLDDDGLTLTSLQPFAGVVGAFPSEGTLRVTDGTDASATLVATSSTSVRIDYDGNGDGLIDSSQARTWSEVVTERG